LIASVANEGTARKRAEELAASSTRTGQPLLLCTYTTRHPGDGSVRRGRHPCYTSMPSCARAIKALADYGRFRERIARRQPPTETTPSIRATVGKAAGRIGEGADRGSVKALLAPTG